MDERTKETIQTLVGGLAHEIKTPLSTIGMNLQLLREALECGEGRSPREERVLAKLGLVEKEISRLGETLNEFLRFIRVGRIEKKPGSINLLVRELLDFITPEAEASRIRVHRNLDYKIPLFHFDFEQIRQAVLNVVKNGVEAMPRGGDLTVETLQRGSDVVVAVTDTGPAISASDRNKIFDPYYSTKPGGTGLGLAATLRAVEDHGGRVELVDPPLGGVRFLLHLPMG